MRKVQYFSDLSGLNKNTFYAGAGRCTSAPAKTRARRRRCAPALTSAATGSTPTVRLRPVGLKGTDLWREPIEVRKAILRESRRLCLDYSPSGSGHSTMSTCPQSMH